MAYSQYNAKDTSVIVDNTYITNMWTLHVEGYEGGNGVHPTEEYERRFLTSMICYFLQGLM